MSRSLLLSHRGRVAVLSPPVPPKTPEKSALDKATLEAYVRHLFVMDHAYHGADFGPQALADLPGFVEVTVHASLGPQSQDFKFFVSKDGSQDPPGQRLRHQQQSVQAGPGQAQDRRRAQLRHAGRAGGDRGVQRFRVPLLQGGSHHAARQPAVTYPEQVHLYFKEFPLESLHPWAKAAAIAGRCVLRQNASRFWDFHDWIFAHQADITPENLKDKVMEWAKAGTAIDSAKLGACIDSKATEAEVEPDPCARGAHSV